MPALYRDFDTQAQIDAQYNPSLLLKAGDNPGQHYAEQAHIARSTLRCTLDVPFGPTLAETLDIFPADQANAPVFIFIHGGYWRAFGSKDFSSVALGLTKRGVTTVVINYALCPFVSIDEITRQTRAAVAWTLRNIANYGGDPTRVAVGGHSAGGHLAAMCLQTNWTQDYGLPQDPLAAGLLINGLYDLQPLRYSYLQPMIQLDDGVIRRNSPAFLTRPCSTPVWATWGGNETEEFARQSATLHAAWQQQGGKLELSPIPDTSHFTVIHGFEDPNSALCDWLAGRLGLG
jgi:arylformamidase